MPFQDSIDRALAALRERAELSGGDLAALVREVELHRAELELQNLDLLRELERSRDECHELFSRAPVAHFRVDARATVQAVNDHALRLLGLDRAQLVGHPLTTIVAPADHERVLDGLDHADDAPPLQVGLRGAHGREVDTCVLVRPLPDRGAGRRALVTALDASLLRRIERAPQGSDEDRELEEERRRSQRLDSLGRLASGIAHDMNNVLATILGLATVLERDATSPESLDDLRTLVGAATRGHDLTRKLLAFARRGSTARTTIRFGDVITDIAGLLRHTHGRALGIEVDVPEAPIFVHANASELGQVLVNLAINAIDAMGDGGKLTFHLRLAGPPEARRAALEVRDTGTGMDPETLDRAFEPFYTTKPQGKGLGLGLSTVYGFVREHGGAIRLRSGVGGGTIVRIALPALDPPALAAGPASTALPIGRLRVLVVDDEPAVLAVTCRVLRNAGHAVDPAQSGGEALYTLEHASAPPDVVLLDIDMPRMNGVETARRILERWPDQAIVFMSGLHDGEATSLAVRRARGFVAKPFTLAELTAALARAREPA